MEKILCFTVLLVVATSIQGFRNRNPNRSLCSLSQDIGPCRFIEPCKPSLLSWNETFIIVSWESLFQGCNEDQISQMWIKSAEGKAAQYREVTFAKNRTHLERKFCDNSKIALRIDFKEDHVNFPNNIQQRVLFTQYNDCKNIIISVANKSNAALVGIISAGKLFKAMAPSVNFEFHQILHYLTLSYIILYLSFISFHLFSSPVLWTNVRQWGSLASQARQTNEAGVTTQRKEMENHHPKVAPKVAIFFLSFRFYTRPV